MKRLLSVLMSLCLVASLATSALAAPAKTSGAANTLRLESTEGSVQLKNAVGKNLKITKGARLYSGYALATKKASYAYVSLDDTKAVKLDASTSTEVFQSGKKLELKVNSGRIFFNVSAPLKSDESLTIRTSNMVTGVRGTCGWVETVDRHTTRISLLEGKLTVTSTDPLTQTQRTTTIVGGQTATIVYHGPEQGSASETPIEDETIQDLIEDGVIKEEHIIVSETGLTVETLQEEDVPGAVAVEVKKDPALQEKIEESTKLSVPEIIGDAEERVEAEETQAEAKDADIQDTLEDLGAEVVDPVFEEEAPQESSSGGGSSTPDPEQPAEYGISVRCVDTMNDEVFYSYEIVGPEGDPYTVRQDEFAGYTLESVEGDLSGTLDSNKTVTFYYTRGWIELDDPATADLETALNTVGYAWISIINANQTNDLDLVAASGGVLTRELDIESGDVYINQGDTMTLDEGGALYVTSASLTNDGTLVANGILEVSSGGKVNNAGEMSGSVGITHGGAVLNSGTFTGSLGLWGNPCVFSNTGTCTLTGVSSSGGGGDISSSGILNITGPVSTKSLSITGGTATITENGSVTISADAEMIVSGAGTSLTNNGTITVEKSSTDTQADGSFSLSEGVFYNNGTIASEGILGLSSAELNNNGEITSNGGLELTFGSTLNNNQTLTNNGILDCFGGTGTSGLGTINNTGSFIANGDIDALGSCTINNSGDMIVGGDVGSTVNAIGGTLTVKSSSE